MNTDGRRRRFKQRIQIEREVLSTVNKIDWETPMTGLTDAAISSWAERQLQNPNAISVLRIVSEISRRLALNADDSRDVFENEELVPSCSVDSLIANLETTVNATLSAVDSKRMGAISLSDQ